jgi:membrane-bound lytic murein transglycosylase D
MKKVLVILINLLNINAFAQSVEVPTVISFANMTLQLTPEVREKVQKKVNNLMSSSAYYQEYVNRCDLYFPIIEKVFEEENIPQDFKYQALQESALVATARSSSHAVGYWQFKDFTAKECLMRVDDKIDQRKNIADATKGAAIYHNKNYPQLKNWVFTLLAYNLGAGGAKNHLKLSNISLENADIDKMVLKGESTGHMYIVHFLAHKVAFENAIGKQKLPFNLLIYTEGNGQTLQHIAYKTDISLNDLKFYNAWLNDDVIPLDKKYSLILPIPVGRIEEVAHLLKIPLKNKKVEEVIAPKFEPVNSDPILPKNEEVKKEDKKVEVPEIQDSEYPKITNSRTQTLNGILFTLADINGLKGFVAGSNYDIAKVAEAFDMSVNKFRKLNDLGMSEPIKDGEVYYVEKKKSKGDFPYYDVVDEENIWKASQNLGIQLKVLAKNNDLSENEALQRGRVLWLQQKRPKNVPIEVKPIKQNTVNLDNENASSSTQNNNTSNTTPTEEQVKKEEPISNEQPKEEKPEIVVEPEKELEEFPVDEGFYRVKEDGESLFAISRRFGVSVMDLKAWNELPPDLSVKKGQNLRVAPPKISETVYKPTKQGFNDPEKPILVDEVLGEKEVKKNTNSSNNENSTVNQATNNSSESYNDRGKSNSAYERVIHVVKSGERLTNIATMYGVSAEDIITWNDLPDRSLDVGQELLIKKTKTAKSFTEVANNNTSNTIDYTKTATNTNSTTSNEVKNTTSVINSNVSNTTSNKVVEVSSSNLRNAQGLKIHVVQKGEGLYRIAKANGVLWTQIQEWNNLPNANAIKDGMELIVEDPKNTKTSNSNNNNEVVKKANEVVNNNNPYDRPAMEKPVSENNKVVIEKSNVTVENASSQQPEPIMHTVKSGETMFKLTQMYKVTAEQIRQWNNLPDNGIKLGSTYIVGYKGGMDKNTKSTTNTSVENKNTSTEKKVEEKPVNTTTGKPVYHKVEANETLFSIAVKYKVSMPQIKELNKDLKGDIVVPGTTIRVK